MKSSYQMNPVAQQITKKKELEILGWTPDEIQQVMDAEMQQQQTMMDQPQAEGMEVTQQPVMA